MGKSLRGSVKTEVVSVILDITQICEIPSLRSE